MEVSVTKNGWVTFDMKEPSAVNVKKAILDSLFPERKCINKEFGMYEIPNGVLSIYKNRVEFKLIAFNEIVER